MNIRDLVLDVWSWILEANVPNNPALEPFCRLLNAGLRNFVNFVLLGDFCIGFVLCHLSLVICPSSLVLGLLSSVPPWSWHHHLKPTLRPLSFV
ncbi:hypothetical protein LC653_29340 [Nostoc sp. CHAB 5784]|uniref:hypothetical protein n=1 Tax=Nostoc mirabile TaxID=2907820 RepID=UPI001E4BFD57|nr:hypothetical protein [Nostoc mirabile]MCC5667873.1 hypothetical protein [Nostoc mirabile CHAB5784]